MSEIINPVLPGFHPDPCLCRRGEDYYLATSTFEWYPGVRIFHSRDFRNWRLAATPLDRPELLDLCGTPCSGGVWAPALSYADGLFWLIYTDMKHYAGTWKDAVNYLTTAPAIAGPWSPRVRLNTSGFDPSLFHDEDGRQWLLNQQWNGHEGCRRFDGILIQEYDAKEERLLGQPRRLFEGTELDITEGPHIFRREDYYYLVCAEGGTQFEHAVTLARSRSLDGFWEVHPENPLLTAQHEPENPLQKAGHGSFIELTNGEWYLAHLCSRPQTVEGQRRCMLGRETAVQKIRWDADGWPRLAHGGNAPASRVPAPALPERPWPKEPARQRFDGDGIPSCFQSLRVPVTQAWADLKARPGYLRLCGRESLHSRFEQSLLARRIEDFECRARLRLSFEPEDYHQAAGLVVYYNLCNWAYLTVTRHLDEGPVVELLHCENSFRVQSLARERIPASSSETADYVLSMQIRETRLSFEWGREEGAQARIGPELDASRFSDDFVEGQGFTGAFVGFCCQDHAGLGRPADFAWFEYEGFPQGTLELP